LRGEIRDRDGVQRRVYTDRTRGCVQRQNVERPVERRRAGQHGPVGRPQAQVAAAPPGRLDDRRDEPVPEQRPGEACQARFAPPERDQTGHDRHRAQPEGAERARTRLGE
jgi:hypothetical protein